MASGDVGEDENNLETLLAKATNPFHRQPEPESLAAFCQQVEKDHDGPQTALRLLAHKIQSPLEKESLLALAVLEESVRRCGSKFRSEVGKFRFLNEMVKVVSPKYLGMRASPKVKQKIVELMYLWSMELKQEVKIQEAYQMLRRQGVVIEDPLYIIEHYKPSPPVPPPPPPRPKDAIFDDDERAQQLRKLLNSKKPEDLQAANRLIKNMVKEADLKMELKAKRVTELETSRNNAKVLLEMLDHYNVRETSNEEQDLMKELYESCERLKQKLIQLAGELDEKEDNLIDVLKVNDDLTIAISQYKKVMGIDSSNSSTNCQDSGSTENGLSLLDLQPTQQPSTSPPSDTSLLDDQLLALGLNDMPSDNQETNASSTNQSALNDLDQLFRVENIPSTSQPSSFMLDLANAETSSGLSSSVLTGSSSSAYTALSNNIPLIPSLSDNKPTKVQSNISASKNPNPVLKGFEELDQLGQSMLKNSLPSSSAVKVEFPSTPQKISLSQLKQQQKDPPQEPLPSTASSFKETTVSSIMPTSTTSTSNVSPTHQSPAHEVLSLADVFVPIETIQPGTLAPLPLLEKNGLTVVMHFGQNCPRPDVSVMVVSTMSKSTSPIKNFNFQAAVPKSMKIKLQPPSATDLPPHNPILPPAAITQVLLLANPQKEKVRFKYKVSYNLNDEDCIEISEVDDLFCTR